MKKNLQISVLALAFLSTSVFISCKEGNNATENKSGKMVPDGQSVDLKFRLQAGSSYVYTADVKQDINSMGMKSTNNIFSEYTYAVTEAGSGNVKMNVSYDKMRMEMDMNGQKTNISSEQDDENAKSFKALIGKPFSMEISPEGKIISIDGWEELGKSANIKTDDIKQMMESSINFYPEKPVKVGESWTKETSSNMQMFKMNIKSTYTLKEIKGDVAILDTKANISMLPDESMKSMEMKMEGGMEGEMQVDIPSGLAISGNLTQDIKGTMTMQGQSMPLSIKSKITMSGKKK